MYPLVVETEVKYQQLTRIEKAETVVLSVSWKEIRQLIERIYSIHLQSKNRRQILRRKRGRICRQRGKMLKKIKY